MSLAGQVVWRRVVSWFVAIVSCIVTAICAEAHGPFDNSSLVLVREETIEVVVTMGMDGSRQFLARSGLSEADSAVALANRGPSTSTPLSVDLAPKFFDVESAGEMLKARSVSVMNDGLEAAFTIIYPRPATSSLRFRALYFTGIEMMTRGSLIATDENHNTLGAAMLSRAEPAVEIKLALSVPEASNTVEVVKQSSAVNVPMNSEPPVATAKAQNVSRAYIWVIVSILAVLILCIGVKKLARRA